MGISFKKVTYIFLILSLGVFTSCKSEDEELINAVEIPDPGNGNTDPVQPDPSDPPAPVPIKGKRKVIIGNYSDENTAKPKKDSKGYTQEGVWLQSSLSGHKGSISRYSRDANPTVTYETSKLGEAKYCVSVFKVGHINSESDTLIKVFDDEREIASKSFNYTYGNGWTHMGELSFVGAKVSKVVISRGENSNGGVLRADEVRFLKVKEGFDCRGKTFAVIKNGRVLDNKFNPDAVKPKRDSAGYREFGEFRKSALPGFKNSISRYSNEHGAYFSYSAKVQKPNYCLKIYRVTHPNSATEVKVTVSQEDTVLKESFYDYSLNVSEKGWIKIGNLNFDTTKPVVIKVEKTSAGNGVLRADALKFQKKACK